MAIPSNPTVTSICTAALKQAGMPSPTDAQVTELAEDGFQSVKTQMWLHNPTDHLLETRYYLLLQAGKGYLTTPADLDAALYIDVYSGPEGYAGTAQSGTSTTITLASDFSAEESAVQGLFIFITGGTGVGQHRQILNLNTSTKEVTVNAAWLTTPDSTTTYLITTEMKRLIRDDEANGSRTQLLPNIGYPKFYTVTSVAPPTGSLPAYRIFPAPNHNRYACVMTYRPNLTLLDETGTLFVKHLRERRTLWMQGTKVEAMQRYDDDRYAQALQIWELMLKKYATHNYTMTQSEGYR